MKILISGGLGSGLDFIKDESFHYDRGVILTVDLNTKKIEKIFEYNHNKFNKENYLDKNPAICFKASFLLNENEILLTTSTEIIKFDLSKNTITETISHPLMNDVHHAIFHRDMYYIANTGRDSVLILSHDGKYNDEIFLDDHIIDNQKKIRYRYQDVSDFRKIRTTKPHNIHPNYLSIIEGEIYVTRFFQKDMISISSEKKINIDVGNPHDGLNSEFGIFATTTNGNIFRLKNKRKQVFNISSYKEFDLLYPNTKMGWFRGILPLSYDEVLIATSVLRPTKSLEFLIESKNKLIGKDFQKLSPTRIDLCDLKNSQVLESINLEKHIHAIFSINKFP